VRGLSASPDLDPQIIAQEAAELEEGEISQEDKLAERKKDALDAVNEQKVTPPPSPNHPPLPTENLSGSAFVRIVTIAGPPELTMLPSWSSYFAEHSPAL